MISLNGGPMRNQPQEKFPNKPLRFGGDVDIFWAKVGTTWRERRERDFLNEPLLWAPWA